MGGVLRRLSALALCAMLAACGNSDSGNPGLNDYDNGGPGSASCLKFIQSLPKDYFHGYVTVPEDPSLPNGTQLQIFYYGKPVSGQMPVAVFNGGPTSNSHSTYGVLSRIQAGNSDYAPIPFVYIDQRGTGCSTPYPRITTYPALSSLALYGSRGIVRDAEAIRQKLVGDKPWKILGQSYGGMIVHRYVTMAPMSIASATSHGFALTLDPYETILQRIASQNHTLLGYFAKYPDDQATLQMLNTQLAGGKCFAHGDEKICGLSVLSPFISALGFVDQWAWIHHWLSAMQTHGGIFQDWIDRVIFAAGARPDTSARLADAVIWHNEMTFASLYPDLCHRIYADLTSRGQNPNSWLLTECSAEMNLSGGPGETMGYIQDLPQDLISPDAFAASLRAYPSLKFYLYSGDLDPYSPVAIFKDELAATKNLLTYFEFPNSGHDGFYSEDLVWRNMLLNPRVSEPTEISISECLSCRP